MTSISHSLTDLVREGRYFEVLTSAAAGELVLGWARQLFFPGQEELGQQPPPVSAQPSTTDVLVVATAALNAFLQINVTGPVPDPALLQKWEKVLVASFEGAQGQRKQEDVEVGRRDGGGGGNTSHAGQIRRAVLDGLGVDGVAAYAYIPSVELFGLARHLAGGLSPGGADAGGATDNIYELDGSEDNGLQLRCSVGWVKLRVKAWHYRLLVQPSLSGRSIVSHAAQWSDVPTLQGDIQRLLDAVERHVMGGGEEGATMTWKAEEKVLFLLEKANLCIMLGQDAKAKEAISQAAEMNRFAYVLSGALGKRTRFQEKSTSQLVVLAKSLSLAGPDQGSVLGHRARQDGEEARPAALPLNDDTLLEEIDYSRRDGPQNGEQDEKKDLIPAALRDLPPDDQPQLSPLDQITLLTEATLKDAFSPTDELTSEEILPFATRVISDKSTNWQINTQALLVRSRVEVHRSRTVERGILQMQAVVDQVIVDTSAPQGKTDMAQNGADSERQSSKTIPQINITAPNDAHEASLNAFRPMTKPTSIFPAVKISDTSPAEVRLRYIHALSTPPRLHLESELAYSWAGVGSLVSALEIFQRLRLWAEVALCLAASGATNDEDGRRSGGEEKARAVVRWRLFRRTDDDGKVAGSAPQSLKEGEPRDNEPDMDGTDISDLKAGDFEGPERTPLPADAPRLFCILGDLENTPSFYERAWEISQHRYARAQRSLGEFYIQQTDWDRARDAYRKAVTVNRLNSNLWNRLGDINLRLGAFSDAAGAFRRAVASAGDGLDGEDARTYSNLGSALYSMYVEAVKEMKETKAASSKDEDANKSQRPQESNDDDVGAEEDGDVPAPARDPARLLSQSLAAYKRGAAIAHDNWRIWDNVLTLASRVRPLAVADMVQALRSIIAIRRSEDALDVDVLRLLLNEAVISKDKQDQGETPTTSVSASEDQTPDGAAHLQHQQQGGTSVYDPPRGSAERAVCQLLETEVAPLITARSELWELLVRERVWRRDFAGAVDAAERAWRAATQGRGGGGLGGGSTTNHDGKAEPKNWLEDKEAWETVVERTEDLVSVLENYGPEVTEVGAKWKGRARAAVRSVMSRGRDSWEGSGGWDRLKRSLDSLK